MLQISYYRETVEDSTAAAERESVWCVQSTILLMLTVDCSFRQIIFNRFSWKLFPCMKRRISVSRQLSKFTFISHPRINTSPNHHRKKVQGAYNCGKPTLSRFHTITTWSPTNHPNSNPQATYGPFSYPSPFYITIYATFWRSNCDIGF